jgi:hypothetical protein
MLSSLEWSKPFRDAESRRNATSISARNSPGALTFRGTRGLLTPIRRGERALSIDQFGDLSIDHIIAPATRAT